MDVYLEQHKKKFKSTLDKIVIQNKFEEILRDMQFYNDQENKQYNYSKRFILLYEFAKLFNGDTNVPLSYY